ncbi:RNA-guided endonuclease InsQ/TnpB family protein [Actinomadura latina]|uniref:Transposase n=1 Tax=Actinomadura latina TaxID=163603 RepID=A0A846Z3C1_9ACTN|nr:RNA-guided endonuclease TnpB family protein [Actinomadura latina]NKZ06751.1 transposase [Actinomadura latina]
MTQRVRRSFRYRFYPTPEQAEHLSRTFGCVRLVYNMALEARIRARRDGRPMTYRDSSAALTNWKRNAEFSFLNDVSCVPPQQALRHLQTAFGNHLAKRAGHPRFKSRKRARATAVEPLEPTQQAVGLDAGISALVTTSAGEKVRNPRHERSNRRRLLKAQRVLSRRRPGSANHAEARLRLARVHARIADRRRDHLHKLTTRLVRENQTVVIEDLHVGGMIRNHHLARHRGCGAVHDRDVNAARNILAAGLAERRNACGADVRPQREASLLSGPSVTKQEFSFN